MIDSPSGTRSSLLDRGWTPVLLVLGICSVAVAFVWFSLSRPEPETWPPSPVAADPPAEPLSGPQLRTVDASDAGVWRYFSFERGSVIEAPARDEWDLAFRRFQMIVNGGEGFAGEGGALALDGVEFGSVGSLPVEGYVPSEIRSDSSHTVLRSWYEYSFLSHLLTPRPVVYAIRTAGGRHVKLEFLGYYCPGPIPGCLTFRYEWVPGEG